MFLSHIPSDFIMETWGETEVQPFFVKQLQRCNELTRGLKKRKTEKKKKKTTIVPHRDKATSQKLKYVCTQV